MLVADRVTADARDRLAEAGWGWFDRRGHLRLRSPGMLVDTNVHVTTRESNASKEPIRGRAGVAIAYRLLTHSDEPVSTTRSGLDFAPSTISEALTRLRDAGLVDDAGLAVTPELFWALADRWRPERTWLAEQPDPEANDTAGWCVTGTVAATELGAPVVSTGAPPDLYVPAPVVVTIAARRYGVALDANVAAASIAVAPATEVTDDALRPVHHGWPLAHPVAVALDLAQDRARSAGAGRPRESSLVARCSQQLDRTSAAATGPKQDVSFERVRPPAHKTSYKCSLPSVAKTYALSPCR